ncbi:MAG: OsmC family protein [Bacteroidales bacterium]|nr:OsmC family protein [Bacteroidales bacterium]MBK8881752.1 OsmC family protein [Bacteroidales bacterium]
MTIDKSKELKTSIQLVNQKLHFEGKADGNNPVSIDYTPPLGDNLGYTSLELFLLSLSSCTGSALLVILRKMEKNIDFFEVISNGYRRAEHPTGFNKINIQVNLKSGNISSQDMTKAIDLIKDICPVLSMLDAKIKVVIEFKIAV